MVHGFERLPDAALWELADLLAGIVRDSPRGRSGRDRKRQLTSELGCPVFNGYVRDRTQPADDWTDADTWALVSRAVLAPGSPPELRHLLALDGPYGDDRALGVSGLTIGQIRRGLARPTDEPYESYARLRRAVVAEMRGLKDPASLTVKGTEGERPRRLSPAFAHMVSGLETAIRTALSDADFGAPSRRRARAAEIGLLTDSLRARLQLVSAKLRAVPSYYPQHLTPLDLAEGRLVANLQSGREPVQLGRHERFGSHTARPGRGRPALEVMAAERRLVLLGDPGSGKSTLGRAAVLAQGYDEDAVAVFVSAPLLARNLEEATEPATVLVARQALTVLFEISPADADVFALAEILAVSPSSLIVIDGLDEVLDPRQRHLLDIVVVNLEAGPGRLILSSRLVGYRRRPGWREMVTLTLSEGFDVFLQRWYGSLELPVAARALEAYRHSPGMQEMVSNPTIAGLVARLASRPNQRLATSRPRLYADAIEFLCEQNWKAPHAPARGDDEAIVLMQSYDAAAWVMAVGAGAPSAASATTSTTLVTLSRAGVDTRLLRSGELLMANGVPAEVAEMSRPWIWLHRSFADHLVAQRMLELWHDDPDEAKVLLREAVQYPTAWVEPLRFFFEAADPGTSQAALQTIWELCEEGDPGSLILGTLEDVLEDDEPSFLRFVERFAPEDGASEFGSAHPVPDIRVAGFVANVPAALGISTHATRAPGVARRLMRQGILTRAPIELAPTAREHLPEGESVSARSVRMTSLTDPELYLTEIRLEGADDDTFPAKLAALVRVLTAPQNEEARTSSVEASGEALEVSERDTAANTGEQLLTKALSGDFGSWAALNAGLAAPAAVDATPDAARLAHVGAGIAVSLQVWGSAPTLARLPTVTMPTDFGVDDLEDDARLQSFVDALRSVGPDTPRDVMAELLRIAARVGSISPASLRPLQDSPNNFAVTTEELHTIIQRAIGAVIYRLDPGKLAAVALELDQAGEPVTASVLSRIPVGDATDLDRTRTMAILRFALDTSPATLNESADVRLSSTDASFVSGILDAFGPELRATPNFFDQLVMALAETGNAVSLRPTLLALTNMPPAPKQDT